MPFCNLCRQALADPLYVSPTDVSMTSLALPRPGKTRVYFCDACAHVQTEPLPDVERFYESEYRILLDSEEQDQLYAIDAGRKIFRVEHQVKTLLDKLNLPEDATVLDFGCAKGATSKRLIADRPNLHVHLFDVSTMYQPYWQRFIAPDRCATRALPADWANRFDVVMSFFVMEHIPDPVASLRQQALLLAPGGSIYFIVPNLHTNPADLIVADHVNHFTRASIAEALRRASLTPIAIDDQSHQGAWIVCASGGGPSGPPIEHTSRTEIQSLAHSWTTLASRITAFESPAPAAVYGSGFYGSFIASCLTHPEQLRCFIDRNPHLQGKTHMNHPILPPESLPPDIQSIYVGLPPRNARNAIAELTHWRNRNLRYFYLDDREARN